ncbi:hypothetical protein [Desulfatiglans anilini]|uniref:hypothetical protein n=1 Tax=Desulfatiglans anilini TaxID=90728 RepID=UPI001294686D|nr:hypothetical protein [Desulfatiglans anilini]
MDISSDHNETGLRGIVTARKCSHCGHHEIGLVTLQGVFHPLLPGMLVQLLEPAAPKPTVPEPQPRHEPPRAEASLNTPDTEVQKRPWAPEPVLNIASLRLKYGVFLPEQDEGSPLDGPRYIAAYIEKITALAAKEEHPWTAVLLDQYLKAAYLAYDDPRQTAQALWSQIEEIRRPAEQVADWLQNPDETTRKSLLGVTAPERDAIAQPVSIVDFAAELESLTLERFLESL